jgi:hypothetical protein
MGSEHVQKGRCMHVKGEVHMCKRSVCAMEGNNEGATTKGDHRVATAREHCKPPSVMAKGSHEG